MIWTRAVERARDLQEGKRRVTGPMEDIGWRGSWSGNERDVLFLNPEGPRFVEMGYSLGVDFDDDGRAVVPVDFDGDGDLDLAIHGLQQLRLVENRTPARKFARVQLVETKGDRHALGAVVKVEAGGVVQQDYMKATAGFAAQVPLELHFGLGDAAKIDRLSVTWRDGTVEEFRDLPVDRVLTVTRGATSPAVSELKRWPEETRPKHAPRFSLSAEAQRLDGSRGRLVEGRGPVVVNFWSPTCEPCQTELPELKAVSERVAVIGISTERGDLDAVRAAVQQHGLGYPQFVADDALMASFFGQGGEAAIPATFVFDEEGRLRRAFRRPVTRAEIEALVASFGRGTFHVDYMAEGLRAQTAGDLDAAARALERSIQENPNYPVPYNHLAGLRIMQRRFQEAADLCRKAVELMPEYAPAHYNLGWVLFALGRHGEAETALRNAARIDDRAATRELIARTLLQRNSLGEAEREVRAALELDPRHVESLVTLARLHDMRGQPQEARKLLERALEVNPSRGDIRAMLNSRR